MSNSGSTPDELRQFASAYDMYDRLAATLDQPDIDGTTTRAVVLQLAGAPARATELGEDIRGDIHLAIVSDAKANLSRFFSAVLDLAPQNTAHINGTSVTLAGAVGSVSGGSLTPGPLLDADIGLTAIEELSSAGEKTQTALQQIMDSGSYSFTKSNYRDIVSASGSVLLGTNPKYGNFDEFESAREQLNLSPSLLAGVDLYLVNIVGKSGPIETGEESLDAETARQYLSLAREKNPDWTAEANAEISDFLSEVKENATGDEKGSVVNPDRLRETLRRFATAHARLRLANQTTGADVRRIIPLFLDTFDSLGIISDREELDADVVETGKTEEKSSDKIMNVRRLIVEMELEYDEGVPIDVIIQKGEQMGLSESKTRSEIEKLKHQGELYEPLSDRVRTT